MVFILRFMTVANCVCDGRSPKWPNPRSVRSDVHDMPRGHRVDTPVRSPVWTSTVGEQTGHVYVVDLVRLRPIDQWVQAGGPEDAMPLYTVVKGPHTGEVTGEQNGFSYPIPDDQAPVANQVRQTLHSPDFVGGCGE